MSWGLLKSTCRIDTLGLLRSIPGSQNRPQNPPWGSQNRGQGRSKMRENSKRLTKCASRAILGGLRWPQWSILGAIWVLWGSTAGHFGLHLVVHGPFWTSRFLCFYWRCFLITFLVIFYDLWGDLRDCFSCWFIASRVHIPYMILWRFGFVLWSAFCIGEPLAICVLHNKNNGFHTFSIFWKLVFRVIF